MAERDYKKEYERRKSNGYTKKMKTASTTIPIEMYNLFAAKAENEGLTVGRVIYKWIEEYTYGSNQN